MALTLEAARTALRRALADTAAPAAWSDDDLDRALAGALAALDGLAPWSGTVLLAAGGSDRLPLPGAVRRVVAVLQDGVPLAGWHVWAGELVLAEPVQGTLEVRAFLARTLPGAPSDPLPLADGAEEAFVLAAARETLLAVGLTHHARRQGPPGPLVAALATARAERERAARALPRVVRTVPRLVAAGP